MNIFFTRLTEEELSRMTIIDYVEMIKRLVKILQDNNKSNSISIFDRE